MFLSLCLSLFIPAQARQPAGAEKQAAQKPEAQAAADFVNPSDFNVRVEPDARAFIVMAAINMAGFDYEPGGQPLSPARAELRKDLAKLDPQVKARLAEFYKAHRRPEVDEALDAARYAALSLLMAQPPSFSIYQLDESRIPADLKQLMKTPGKGEPLIVELVREFYLKSGVKELIPKYTAVGQAYAASYRRPVGEMIYRVFDYFHTRPETSVSMKPLVVTKEQPDKSKKESQKVVARTRTRYVFVMPDPLSAINTSTVRDDILNQKDELLTRRVGDDYIVTIGPSRAHSLDAVRQALIRFVIDPIVERHLRASLEYKDQITKLVAGIPTASKQFAPSVYLVIRESLAQAAEARMKRIQAAQTRGAYSEDDATYDLAQAYLRGAALAFHFYDALKGAEQVGINIEDYFDQMVATANFEREAGRAKQFEPVMARVTAARKAAATKPAGDPLAGTVAAKIILSDDLIQQRRYAEAKNALEEILALEPKNARALYGMAQVVNNAASPVENDPKADEDDKIQAQHDRLEAAIKLYRKTIENASPAAEAWLIQWSHVLIGRILDFQEFRNDAVAEYEKAIALGEIPNGAYREAQEGKQRPYGQKPVVRSP